MHNLAHHWHLTPQPRAILARLHECAFYTDYRGELRPLTDRPHRMVIRLEVLRRDAARRNWGDLPSVQDALRQTFAARRRKVAA